MTPSDSATPPPTQPPTPPSNGPSYGAGSTEQPVCPRHPDQVSYVRCKNCHRPACGQCQVPTEVGVLCVDCQRDANRAAAQTARQRAGGRGAQVITDKRGNPIPLVTYILIAACVVIYIVQWLTNLSPTGFNLTQQLQYAGLYTSQAGAELGQLEPWRMITSAFVHSVSNPLHLLLNMLVLWMMGRELEPVLGWARFLAIYLVSAIGGSVAVLWLSHPLVGVVGASGAVYGLFAAMFLLVRASGGQLTSITVLIVINLAFSFLGSGISWQGHIGGLVTGGVLSAMILGVAKWQAKKPVGQRSQAKVTAGTWASVAIVLVVLILLTVWGGSQITLADLA